jgi:membrane-associated phospholipid phosphatase
VSFRSGTIGSRSGCGGTCRTLLTPAFCVLLLVTLIFGGIFLYLGEEVHESETLPADRHVLRVIDDHTASWPVAIANDISLLGAEVTIAALGVALAVWCLVRKRRLDALLFLAAIGGYAVLTFVIKQIVQRERPIAFFRVPESGYSFPSGHTLGATCLAFALGYLLWRGGARRGLKMLGTVLLAFAVLAIGLSRLMLGVHYPTDVLGSMALGTVWMSGLFTLRYATGRWQVARTLPGSTVK